MCHVSLFTLFFTKRLSLLVEGLILTGLVFNLKHIYAWTWQSWILSVLNLISYCFTLHFFCFFLLMDAHHFLHPVFYYYDEFHVMLRLSILAVTLSGTNKRILSHVCNSILWPQLKSRPGLHLIKFSYCFFVLFCWAESWKDVRETGLNAGYILCKENKNQSCIRETTQTLEVCGW